jgi:ankyrin repeat protein
VDAANSYGNTPLSTAVFNSRDRGELIQLLRHQGADPWHPNNTGQTPAGTARLIGNYDVAQFFADLTDPTRIHNPQVLTIPRIGKLRVVSDGRC